MKPDFRIIPNAGRFPPSTSGDVAMSIKCLVCGHQNAAEATMCINCGSPLENQAAETDDNGGDATILLGNLGGGGAPSHPSPAGPKMPKPERPPTPPEPQEPPEPLEPPKPAAPPLPTPPQAPPPAGKPPVMTSGPEEEPPSPAEPKEKRPKPPARKPRRTPPPRPITAPAGEDDGNDLLPAPFALRLGAACIDGIIALVLLTILSLFVMSEDFFDKDFIGMLIELRVPIALWILAMTIYFGFMTATAGGQTLGKKATGIRVINAEGFQEVNLGMALARGLLKAVGYAIPPIGLALLLPANWSAQGKGLHDLMTGTRVVVED